MSRKSAARDICALLMGAVALLVFTLLWRGNETLAFNMIKEDGLIENLSSIFWIEAAVICFYRLATSDTGTRLLLYFWGIFSFFCFGEELSWGQRILGYSAASVQDISVQHEVNLHNIGPLSHHLGLLKALKTGGGIDWLGLLSSQNLFIAGFTTYFLILPLIMRSDKLKSFQEKLRYDVPTCCFLLAVWMPIIFSWAISLLTDRHKIMEETREMFMAFVVLFYVIFYLPKGAELGPTEPVSAPRP